MYWSIIGQDVVTPEQQEAFFESGRADVAVALTRAAELARPARRERALDFGCGVGRLTRSLAEHFDEVVGVDIAKEMVDQARLLNADALNCRFDVAREPELTGYDDASFDLVFSRLVLQHLPDEAAAIRCIVELVRVACPDGLVVFQLPSRLPLPQRLQPRRRLYRLLRAAGVRPSALFALGLQPLRMIAVPCETVDRAVARRGATVLATETEAWPHGIRSATYYVAPRPESAGWKR
jgi:SAM-dependent methyltransferase